MNSLRALSAADIIRLLDLKPLPEEGGFYRETSRAQEMVDFPLYKGQRSLSAAIYHLITTDSFSALHRVPGEEVFHFYLGNPVEMLQIHDNGASEELLLGTHLTEGMRPQVIVKGGVWQGLRLAEGGTYALLGTTMAPGFDFADFESGNRDALCSAFPELVDQIIHFTH